jgi:hypothetical protein
VIVRVAAGPGAGQPSNGGGSSTNFPVIVTPDRLAVGQPETGFGVGVGSALGAGPANDGARVTRGLADVSTDAVGSAVWTALDAERDGLVAAPEHAASRIAAMGIKTSGRIAAPQPPTPRLIRAGPMRCFAPGRPPALPIGQPRCGALTVVRSRLHARRADRACAVPPRFGRGGATLSDDAAMTLQLGLAPCIPVAIAPSLRLLLLGVLGPHVPDAEEWKSSVAAEHVQQIVEEPPPPTRGTFATHLSGSEALPPVPRGIGHEAPPDARWQSLPGSRPERSRGAEPGTHDDEAFRLLLTYTRRMQ